MRRRTAILIVSVASLAAAGQQAGDRRAASASTPSPSPEPPASLQAVGHVTVNGRAVVDPNSTLLNGDRIETSSASGARISAAGLALYLPGNSCLTYGGQQFEICKYGSVDVNAMKPVSVIFRDRELVGSSQGKNSAFTMSVAGRELELVNQIGTTEVAKSGLILSRVSAGTSHSFAGLGCTAALAGLAGSGGIAGALAAPAAVSTAVSRAVSNRATVSSFNP